ncbi:sigma-70 family RNA polymerase sigma factor [Streptomyces sp. NPDC002073]
MAALKERLGREADPAAPRAGGVAAPAPAIGELWRSYDATGDERLREQLILHYSPLVTYMAARVGAGGEADLVPSGMFALVDAIGTFDLERGINFETYAVPLIARAMADGLRAPDPVPRSGRRGAWPRTRAGAARQPGWRRTRSGGAAGPGTVGDALQEPAGRLQVRAAEAGLPDPAETPQDSAPGLPAGAAEDVELPRPLARAINELPEREKTVMTLRYYEGLTLAEIGAVLGITENRVRRIHNESVHRLRAELPDLDL